MSDIQARLDGARKTVETMTRQGYKPTGIAKRFKCGENDVREAMARWGVEPYEGVPRVDRGRVLAMHAAGMTAYAIAKELKACHATVCNIINRAGHDISHRYWKRDDPLKNHEEEIVRRYLAGEGADTIGKSFGCREGTNVRVILKKCGVQLRGVRDYSYPVNESFFDNINSEEKAYVLGWMMSDGSNETDVPVITLSITDEDILRRIASVIGWGGPIEFVQPRGKMVLPQYRFRIGSRLMSDALVRAGCVKDKTYRAEFPSEKIVPRHLTPHLVRGWSDGDGTITHGVWRGRDYWNSRIVGTEAACRGLSAAVLSQLGFKGCVCPVHAGADHTTWGFSISGNHQLPVYLDWLYAGSTIRLERKLQKYQEFLAHIASR